MEPIPRHRPCLVGPLLGGLPGWVVSPGETLARHLAADGVAVRATSRLAHPWLRPCDMALSLWRWRREIDSVVILTFSGRSFLVTDLVSRVARRIGRPIVFWLHGGGFPAFRDRHDRWVARVLSRGRALVAPSTYLTEAMAGIGPEPRVIPNVLDLDGHPFRPRRELAPRILWMRTFHPLYRPELALDALAALRRSHPTATLTLAGQDRGLLAALERQAGAMGLDGAVRFPGFLDPAAKRTAFAEHDLFLNTTAVDNAPVSLLEAAAAGLPIVSTAVGGIPHLLPDGRAALLVAEADGAALATALGRLLADPALAERLSRAARGVAEGCRWSEVGPRWRRLFAELDGAAP